jgi:hypothetical protein
MAKAMAQAWRCLQGLVSLYRREWALSWHSVLLSVALVYV